LCRPKTEPGEQPTLLFFEQQRTRSDHHGHHWQDPAFASPEEQFEARDGAHHGGRGVVAQHGRTAGIQTDAKKVSTVACCDWLRIDTNAPISAGSGNVRLRVKAFGESGCRAVCANASE
jgi:hypothetical protein